MGDFDIASNLQTSSAVLIYNISNRMHITRKITIGMRITEAFRKIKVPILVANYINAFNKFFMLSVKFKST